MASLALAVCVILAATANWRVTAIASCSLYAIVAFTFSLMAFAGWEIGVLEVRACRVAINIEQGSRER